MRCRYSSRSGTGPKGASSDRVTIRFCHWQLETGVRDAVAAIIRRYEQLNPRVHVVQIAIPGGVAGATYTTWVLTQMAAGSGPDLVQYDAFHPDVPRLFQPIGAEVNEPNPYNRGTPLAGVRWRDTFVDGMITNFDHGTCWTITPPRWTSTCSGSPIIGV